MAALMAVSTAASVTGSADGFADDVNAAVTVVGDGESSEKGYDEADWEAFRDRYRNDWCIDEDEEDDLGITDDGLIYHRNVPDGCIEVVDYIGKGEELIIPKKIEGMTVTKIKNIGFEGEKYGFSNLKTIKTLKIEAKIETMGSTFYGCSELEKVVLPDGLKSISDYDYYAGLFDYCVAFSDCPKLKEVYIPDSLTFVQGACFEDTPWLEAREKEEGLVIIGKCLLSGRQAEGKVVIPSDVEWVCAHAFYDNDKMTSLVIPASVGHEYTEDQIFSDCTALTKITYKNGCEYALEYTNKKSTPNLKKVILPPSFTKEATKNSVFFNKKPTYYYYKGTPAAAVLESKKYSYAKKSLLPGKTKSIKAVGKSKSVTVKWTSVSIATGYQVQISSDKAFKSNVTKKTIADKTKIRYTFKKLTSGKRYYVRMRTYKTLSGRKYYGNYTKTRAVTVK